MAQVFAILRFVLSTGYIPITVPIECSRIVIENENASVAAQFRTTLGDVNTEKGIGPGQELTLQSITSAFQAGSIVGYMAASSGAGPAVVSYTR